ncbi:MAG: CHASE2 domain-containing protein [Candidatus Omnitrophota bacterium]
MKYTQILVIGLLLTIPFLFLEKHIPPAKFIHFKIYDILNKIEYFLRKPPAEAKDITIVRIDNETIRKMPYRWPYPRSIFADVIKNLAKAQAKVIAFDFVFLGKSEEIEDKKLEEAMTENDNVILACTIDESGSLNIHSISRLSGTVPSGIVTKLQDMDGIIRRNLTYLISDEIPPRGFLSWEMAILKSIEGLTPVTIKGNDSYISVTNDKSEKWMIPVDSYNKSFIINFRAHTGDFTSLSFYDAYKGSFDPDLVKDKMVLIGFATPLLGDVHNTPIGWMPGITLNANSLLTLYTRSFIYTIPEKVGQCLTIAGVLLSIISLLLFGAKGSAIFITAEAIIFFTVSYILLTIGYTWDYFAFPFSIALFPYVSKKIYLWIWQRKKFYWT